MTPEIDLPVVESDPFSGGTPARHNVDYPHRRAELLLFPRRSAPPLEAQAWSSLLLDVGAEIVRSDPQVPMHHIRVRPTDNLFQVAQTLRIKGSDLIESIEANSCVFPQQQGDIPEGLPDPEAAEQWGHWQVDLKGAWNVTRGSRSIVVAVIDSGINHDNLDLKCNLHGNGWNFWDNNNQLSDQAHHGTVIAGIIGACSNDIGVVGINWETSLLDLRVYKTVGAAGALDKILSAIPYAVQNGAGVINASWTTSASPMLESLIRNIANVVVVTAAGDSPGGGHMLIPPFTAYPCNWTLPNLICVTSTSDGTDQKASDANFGAAVHIAAPGMNIKSTLGTDTGTKSGTSFAVPYVTGVVALLRAHFPADDASQIATRALDGDDVTALAGMTQAGRSAGTGRRLNACRALNCSARDSTPGAPVLLPP